MTDIQHIKKAFSSPKYIGIIAHRNPDGDALGSTLALAIVLRKMGHTCHVVMPSEHPKAFDFLPGVSDIVVADVYFDRAVEIFEQAEVICCLDFNALDRVDRLGETIQFSKATKILIDHHMDPEPFADHYVSNTEASSTCELVYDLIRDLGLSKHLDLDVGRCLFTGIITDTGSFKYNTNPRVYEMASELKTLGVDDYALNDAIYNSLREKQLRLLGHCLRHRMEILEEYHTGIIVLNKYDFAEYDIQRGDTEGIVNYLLMMPKIKVAAFITQQPTIVKISLRSKGDFSVQEIAQNHFNGGGHKNAAGGYMHAGLRTVIEKFKEVLPTYINKYNIKKPLHEDA